MCCRVQRAVTRVMPMRLAVYYATVVVQLADAERGVMLSRAERDGGAPLA